MFGTRKQSVKKKPSSPSGLNDEETAHGYVFSVALVQMLVSIKIGQDKLLVIFGIRECDIDFTRPLVFGDLTPLVEMVKPNWNSELIKEQLVSLRETLGTVIYAVGDYGSCIKKGLRLAQVPQVYDITHKIAVILKKLFEPKPDGRYYQSGLVYLRIYCESR